MPAQAPTETMPSEAFLERVPLDFARRHLVLSAGEAEGHERLLVAEGSDPLAVFNVGVRLGRTVEAVVTDAEGLARRIDGAYTRRRAAGLGAPPEIAGGADEPLGALLDRADRDLLSVEGKGDVVRLVDALLFEALGREASDVHLHPLEDRTLVRYRVDGVLGTAREVPRGLTPALVSRVKVMARLDIAEKRVPQDGRATVTIGAAGSPDARSIDLRISTLPTSHGERVVIRLLDTDRGRRMTTFDALGMPGDVRSAYLERAGRPNGIVLLTGPTGSGKTTTLYATLRWIAGRGGGELNIMTIEDPIEYELSSAGVAISQSQVNAKKGVTFATGLRHILRQDPDVVMVGEVRDEETARIAIQSSLTGHLVFSTLHTNDAPSAVTRLVDLGVEPYLVGASLSAVLAQRLVRTRHAACGGAGCGACGGGGFLGRTGLFELLRVDETVADLIAAGAGVREVRTAAQGRGLRCLREDGLRLVREGRTSIEDVDRVTIDLGADGPAGVGA